MFFKNSWNIKGTAVNPLVYAVFEKKSQNLIMKICNIARSYDRVLLFFHLEDVILWRNDRRKKYE